MDFPIIHITYENSIKGYYNLGFEIGSHSKGLIHKALPLDDDLNGILSNLTPASRFKISTYEKSLIRIHPKIHSQLRGLAAGAGVPIETVVASVYRKELHNVANSKGCTDIQLVSETFKGWGHNEDYGWSLDFQPLVIIEATRVDESDHLELRWSSIIYPLCLGGMTIGFNDHGVIFSAENLSPSWCLTENAVSSQVVCQLALEARNVHEFMEIVTQRFLASGRGFTFSDWKNDLCPIRFIETGPGGHFQVEEIVKISGHTNHYLFLPIRQITGPSSSQRMERILDLKSSIETEQDLLRSLWDEKSEFPIYRKGSGKDRGVTQFTCLVDLTSKSLKFFKTKNSKPVIVNLNFAKWWS